ncbi:MAG: hypothetical protein Q8O93_04045 [bacterium]|nr:hypothetical protein [bacterium]
MPYFIITSVFLLLPLTAAKAVPICLVCTAAVSAGVGFSRWLGVDDTITGLWIGALAISVSLLTINWLAKKNIKFFGRQPLIFIIYYGAIIWPLYYYGLAGHPLNKLWGVDKLALGITLGTIGFAAGAIFNEYLKKRNGGKVYFPFQKVVVPVSWLAFISLIFYYFL